MESTPVCGVAIRNDVVAPLLAPSLCSDIAVGRTPHEHSGSGYAFREEGDSGSDAVYKDFSRLLLKEKRIRHVRDIPMLPDWQKAQLAQMLGQRTPSPPRQIGKYLHWHPDAG